MKILIVYAHHEPQSFNPARLQRAPDTLPAQGHEVKVSELHAMNFNLIAPTADFHARRSPEALAGIRSLPS